MAYRQNSQGHGPYTRNDYSPPQPQQQYRNEFNEGYGGHNNTRHNDSYNDGPYDPYSGYNAYNSHQPHQTYEQGGHNQYTGVSGYRDDMDRNSPSPEGDPPVPPSKEYSANTTVYEHDDQIPQARPRGKFATSQKSFKSWRAEGQENLWTRGSRKRTCGRFFCCTVMIAVFLIISILLSLALWVKPPNVTIANPVGNSTQAFTLQNGELSMNLGVNITVDNPNYFGVALKKVELDLIYPINNYPVGGGEQRDINIRSNTQTNFTFPFSLSYNTTDTGGTAVLQDLATKCRARQDLTVNYDLKLSLRIIIVSISPTISNSFTFACPIDPSQIDGLLSGNLGSLGNLLI